MPKPLRERGRLLEATTTATGAVRRPIQIITPGWGSSGYYSAAVLEAAAANRVIPAGTHMYFDHATEAERADRPERSVLDIAAVLTEDARWDGTRLIAEAHILGQFAERIGDLAPHIGVSISGSATDITIGEAEGHTGPIIEGLAHVDSVDFVTHAGRGGKVLEVMEAARPVAEARNIGQWVESRIHRDFTVLADDMAGDGRLTREERIGMSSAIGDALAAFVASLEANQPQLYTRDIWADPSDSTLEAAHRARTRSGQLVEATTNDTRDALLNLLRDAHGGEKTYIWVRDFDDSNVWFEVEAPDDSGLFAQAYTGDGTTTALAGDRTEVRVVTTFVPVTRPDSTTTQESERETAMPQIQIEESEHRSLVETAGRVPTLETERDTESNRANVAEAALATERRRNRAMDLIREHAHPFTPLEARGLVVELPLTEAGEFDETAFTTQLTEHAATVAAAAGAGTVIGFGGAPTSGDQVVESTKPTASPWGRTLNEKGA